MSERADLGARTGQGAETLVMAYADPPYPGQAQRLYGDHRDYAGEVDHKELIERLVSDYPDGWALSTGAKWLREVLLLCPEDVRVLSWHKTDAPPYQLRVQYTWEPVILKGGRSFDGRFRSVRDSLVAPSSGVLGGNLRRHGEHLTGRKPPRFCRWLFECLGLTPDDELHDLFPGSGAVSEAWDAWRAQERLVV